MADLEAIYTDPGSAVRQSWRFALPVARAVRVGRDPGVAEFVIEADRRVSAAHAVVTWDGVGLDVAELDDPRPTNPVRYGGVPSRRFRVRPGDGFEIGGTRFLLRTDAGAVAADTAAPQFERALTAEELDQSGAGAPVVPLRALEELARAVRRPRTEGLVKQSLFRGLLEALPWADGAGVVAVPAGEPLPPARLEGREHAVRTGPGGPAAEFVPSRRLVGRALAQKKSCLHVWRPGDEAAVTLGPAGARGGTPWAVCVPLPEFARQAMYVFGTVPPDAAAGGRDVGALLLDYQRCAQAVAHMLEARMIGFRLRARAELLQDFVPDPLHPYLGDPARVQAVLEPREVEATVLFCDLRGFTRHAERTGGSLRATWEELSRPVHEMSSAIASHGGVVAGFHGDAVLGFWGWPESRPDQVEKAAAAALWIQRVLAKGLRGFQCGVGLSHGPVVAGRLGAVALSKVDVFGPTVNLASRLEGLTKVFGVPVLADGAVAARLPADPGGRARTRRLGRVVPKGMAAGIDAHELFLPATADEFDASARAAWDEIVELFLAGHWVDAHDRLATEFPDDPPAKYLMAYMTVAGPGLKPPPGWVAAGAAIVLTEK
jgi:class 3 adenylate cyclase